MKSHIGVNVALYILETVLYRECTLVKTCLFSWEWYTIQSMHIWYAYCDIHVWLHKSKALTSLIHVIANHLKKRKNVTSSLRINDRNQSKVSEKFHDILKYILEGTDTKDLKGWTIRLEGVDNNDVITVQGCLCRFYLFIRFILEWHFWPSKFANTVEWLTSLLPPCYFRPFSGKCNLITGNILMLKNTWRRDEIREKGQNETCLACGYYFTVIKTLLPFVNRKKS